MNELRALPLFFRDPRGFLELRLASPVPPRVLLRELVAPLAGIRAIATLVASLLGGDVLVGFVLGSGVYVLQIGTWAVLGLVVPRIARQMETTLGEAQAFVLVTYALVPSWLAGVVFVVPASSTLGWVWTRLLFLLVGVTGLYSLERGLSVLEIPPRTRLVLLLATLTAASTIYVVLFTTLGIVAHILLFILG